MAIAPAMRVDKTLPLGYAAFQTLNNPYADPRIPGHPYSPIMDRTIVGDGNVDKWSTRDLNMVWCKTANIREGSDKIHDAVYVVGTLNPTCIKVGMATDPIARLAQLQTGNHEKLYLHRVFWTFKPDAARQLESCSHSFLAKKSKRLVGEWFECSPMIAHDTIINACRSLVLGFEAITPHGPLEVKIEKII
jgi:hypothetical protein